MKWYRPISARLPILLPDMGVPAATFSLWHVVEGDRVTMGERLAEVLIPGVAVELQAEAGGVLSQVIVRPGDVLSTGEVLGVIDAE